MGNSLCVQFGSNFSSEQSHKISIFGNCQTFLGFTCVNYLDDFAGAGDANSAGPAFEYLGILLAHCGFEESRKKATPPSTRMVFLGVIIDSVKSTLEVLEERLSGSQNL